MNAVAVPATAQAGEHDFDFLHGRWKVHNRRLVQRLAGSTEWKEFEATGTCRPVLGGAANEDDFLTDFWPGFIGMSFRFFDPDHGTWSIYWADNRSNVLQPPVVGRFTNGVGTFEGDDKFEGRPIRVRYLWSRISPQSARWEQAFSADQGRNWETNWVMDFTRAGSVEQRAPDTGRHSMPE